MYRIVLLLLLPPLLSLAPSCGGEEADRSTTGMNAGPDAGMNAGPDTGPTDTGISGGESLSALFEPIFVQTGCTAGYCHGSGAGDLMISNEAEARANLVGRTAASAVCGLTDLVVAGDPEASILWARLRPASEDPSPDCAEKMPRGGPAMNEADARRVYEWIAAGAP